MKRADGTQHEAFAELIAESERQLQLLAALAQQTAETGGEASLPFGMTHPFRWLIQGLACLLLVFIGSVGGALVAYFGKELL